MTAVTFLRVWCLCLPAIVAAGCGCSDIASEVEAEFVEHGTMLQVGDTATIRARVLNSGDILCVRYASQAGYGGSVQPDRFTYESSKPGLANITVSAEGLVSSLIPVTVQTPPAVTGAALYQ